MTGVQTCALPIFYWEKDAASIRAVYKFRDDYFKPSGLTANRYVKGVGYMDISASYDLNKHFLRSTIETGGIAGFTFYPHVGYIRIDGPFNAKPASESASRKKILICDLKTGPACMERILSTLAHRAFRRPVTKTEVASLMKITSLAKTEGQSDERALQLAMQAILVSPDFLFRLERDPAGGQVHTISSIEMASRLSYFLWSSMPDDELLALAEAGKLSNQKTLDAQVTRMLADPRSAALAENFAGQWLEIRNLDSMKPDPDKFPDWSAELRDDMRTETRMFFDYILRQNRPAVEFLDARYTFLNEPLARFYGVEGVTGPEFQIGRAHV